MIVALPPVSHSAKHEPYREPTDPVLNSPFRSTSMLNHPETLPTPSRPRSHRHKGWIPQHPEGRGSSPHSNTFRKELLPEHHPLNL